MLSKEMSLGAYDIKLAQMCSDDIDHLHELSLSVRWPHRATDWKELMTMGEGFVARDSMGRLVCSMMYFPMSTQFASIGMGISSPRLQSLGAGQWLAEHIESQLKGSTVYLFATKDSMQLCLSFGFKILQPVFHFNGFAKATITPETAFKVQTLQSEDYHEVEKLDTAAMGFNRGRLIKHLLSISQGQVIYENGKLRAFALHRVFGRGHVIGPIVAENEEQAVALINPIINTLSGQFVRVDTYLNSGYFVEYLSQANLTLHETATKMVRGELPTPSGSVTTVALASQALG